MHEDGAKHQYQGTRAEGQKGVRTEVQQAEKQKAMHVRGRHARTHTEQRALKVARIRDEAMVATCQGQKETTSQTSILHHLLAINSDSIVWHLHACSLYL